MGDFKTGNDSVVKAVNRTLSGFEKERESEWRGAFSFVQAADTQLGLISHLAGQPDDWAAELALTKKAITLVNNMDPPPRFFIICGDMVNESRDSGIRAHQVKDFKKVFKDLREDVPLICVCGNHDVGDKPTPESVQRYRNDFGDEFFAFYCGGVKCIVLNSQYFESPGLVQELAAIQEEWMVQELSDVRDFKHAIIFQHIPLFNHKIDEEKTRFNLDPALRLKLLKKFVDAGIRIIFCGHYHRNTNVFFEDIEIVVTSAVGAQFGNDLPGIRIVKIEEENIMHQYVQLPTK